MSHFKQKIYCVTCFLALSLSLGNLHCLRNIELKRHNFISKINVPFLIKRFTNENENKLIIIENASEQNLKKIVDRNQSLSIPFDLIEYPLIYKALS
ncbi:hypothetical protein [Acinetobacter bereziniae]|uniref:hypothetical protein n=1 Tax=Acinetobacter bereziniae TaxID=106648 RepID=UPI00125031ED|nr:hypothetical protein [Acinetobacter bereziniae]